MASGAVNSVKAAITPILLTVIGFFYVVDRNNTADRLAKIEEKIDRLVKYEIILERLGSGKIGFTVPPISPFKHEEFITLKIVNDEIGII